MRNLLIKVVTLCALLAPVHVLATCTWAATGAKSSTATCTTGTEAAPSAATAGTDLTGSTGFALVIEATSGQTVSGGTLLCYVYNDVSGLWVRNREQDVPIPAVAERGHGFSGFTITSARGRIAFVPSGATISSGNVIVYVNVVGDMIGPLVK